MKIFTCSTFILSIIGSDVSCSWQTQDCTSFLVLFYLEESLSRMQLLLTRTAVFYRLGRCWDTFLINYLQVEILVHIELMILSEHIFLERFNSLSVLYEFEFNFRCIFIASENSCYLERSYRKPKVT